MSKIRIGMELSSSEMVHVVATGLSAVGGVRVMQRLCFGERFVDVIITTSDPDDVEIARELVWQLDAGAVQHSLVLLEPLVGSSAA